MARDVSRRSRLGDGRQHASTAMNDSTTGPHDQITAGDGDPRPQPGRETGVTPTPAEALRQGFTDEPPYAAPPAKRPSRNLQWVIAVVLLAVVVFAAVFAMNYLPYLSSLGSGKPAGDPALA